MSVFVLAVFAAGFLGRGTGGGGRGGGGGGVPLLCHSYFSRFRCLAMSKQLPVTHLGCTEGVSQPLRSMSIYVCIYAGPYPGLRGGGSLIGGGRFSVFAF